MVVGGVIFAGIVVLCVIVGWAVLRKRGDFEPMDESEDEVP